MSRKLPSAEEFRGIGVRRHTFDVAGRVARYAEISSALAGLPVGGGPVLILAFLLLTTGRHEVTGATGTAGESR